MKKIFGMMMVWAAALAASGAMTAKVAWTTRWPWNPTVDIDVELVGGEKCDLAMVANFTTNGIAVTVDLEHAAGVTGDFCELAPGYHHFAWNPAAAGLEVTKLENVTFTATPVENALVARKWLVLDVITGEWEYRAEEPEGGWNTVEYKRTKMVFSRIPAGTFNYGMSETDRAFLDAAVPGKTTTVVPSAEVTIAHDYYLAIFKLTYGQMYRFKDATNTSGDIRPYLDNNDAFYIDFRGTNSEDAAGIDWPSTRFRVADDSFLAGFRRLTSNRLMIDFPTSAQWERAARGGVDTFWYNGGTVDNTYAECTNLYQQIAYSFMDEGVSNYQTTNVGTKLANAYGLYDTLGMRPEWVLDWYVYSNTMVDSPVDPVGPVPNSTRKSRLSRGHHNASGNGLANFTAASLVTVGEDLKHQANFQQAIRLAIHLQPPRSFGGKWE